jgi:hypothetical protein
VKKGTANSPAISIIDGGKIFRLVVFDHLRLVLHPHNHTLDALELHRPRFLIPTNELWHLAIKTVRYLLELTSPSQAGYP